MNSSALGAHAPLGRVSPDATHTAPLGPCQLRLCSLHLAHALLLVPLNRHDATTFKDVATLTQRLADVQKPRDGLRLSRSSSACFPWQASNEIVRLRAALADKPIPGPCSSPHPNRDVALSCAAHCSSGVDEPKWSGREWSGDSGFEAAARPEAVRRHAEVGCRHGACLER